MTRADDGELGLAHLHNHPLPDLVLLDIRMPGIDGREVLDRIRADRRFESLLVVMLTSSDDKDDIMSSYKAGANAFVIKPTSFSDYEDLVNALANFWARAVEALQASNNNSVANLREQVGEHEPHPSERPPPTG